MTQHLLRILLIENNPIDAELCLAVLRRAGLEMESEVIQRKEDFRSKVGVGAYDVILADFNLPGWNGMEAFKYLRDRGDDIPFILVSGAVGDEIAVEYIKQGISDYVLKDSMARLPTAIRRALQEKEVRAKREQVEEEIRCLNEHLEQQVAERTAQLEAANKELHAENSERQRAEQTLEQLRRQFELILNSAGEGVCGLDQSGLCIFFNPAGATMLRSSPTDLTGKHIYDILRLTPPSDLSPSAGAHPIHAILINGEALREENKLLWRQDGTSFVADYIITPIRNDQGETLGAVVVFRDVTERRAVEEMKDEFISAVSHELRTPLTAIRATLGLLGTGKLCGTPGGCQKIISTGLANVERLVRMVSDILDLERMKSRETRIEKKVCDAGELLTQAADLMSVTAESQGVRLVVRRLSARFWADPDRMMQVLINLLGNAIKFSPPETEVSLAAKRVDGELIFQVKDQGRGIPAHKASLVFERFQQVDASDSREKGGTGLGLAICRSIVKQHGGRIWMESKPGRGSTFFFAIPAGKGVHSPAEKKDQKCLERS
ncbi:MAG: ATP-binding protein [Terriglobia bacterium]